MRPRTVLAALYASLMIPAGLYFCFKIPPFRVPDEVAHILRADQVSQGTFLAEKTAFNLGGGVIDSAYFDLDAVMNERFQRNGGTLGPEDIAAARAVMTAPHRTPAAFPNTASYAAFGYLPQAVGLIAARSVSDRAYDLLMAARTVNFLAFVAILALSIWLVPHLAPLVFALSSLPMVLFLASSASQDAAIIAVTGLATVLTYSATRRALDDDPNVVPYLVGLTIAFLFLGLARPPYIPLVLLLPAIALLRKDRQVLRYSFVMMIVVTVCIAAQIAYVSSLGHPTGKPGVDVSGQIAFILTHPLDYMVILGKTLVGRARGLLVGLIGHLGYLDRPLKTWMYPFYLLFLIVVVFVQTTFILSQSDDNGRRMSRQRIAFALLLAGCSFAAIVALIATSQFVAWTETDAALIEGLQGRYFYTAFLPMLAIMLGTIPSWMPRQLTIRRVPAEPATWKAVWLCLALFGPILIFSQFATNAVLSGYYR